MLRALRRDDKARAATPLEAVADGQGEPGRDDADVLASALDALPLGVAISDPRSGRRWRNRRAVAMSGIRYVDVLVDEAVDAMLEGRGEAVRTLETAGDAPRHFELRRTDDPSGVRTVTVEDVTERERIDTVRSDFVANLSHELKTPIGAVAALADSLSGEDDVGVIRRLAERIIGESTRMARIVDDLLDLSRIEFGAPEDWGPVDLGGVVSEVVATHHHAAAARGVSLAVTGSAGAAVLGDRSQLVSALSNLVDNAIKYTERDGSVRVRCAAIGDEAVLEVEDSGIGIAPAQQERIFERFYRVDKARSRGTGGTGLGLSIVRHIVANHGGTVAVASEEGRGSTFTVRLPLAS